MENTKHLLYLPMEESVVIPMNTNIDYKADLKQRQNKIQDSKPMPAKTCGHHSGPIGTPMPGC
jgi:hypothetical protein